MLTLKEKYHTIKDYKLLPEGSPYQLIEGELIMTPAPSPLHQLISGNLYERIRSFTKEKGMGVVFYSPIDIYLDEENVYQPDIVFVSKEKNEMIKEDGVHGAPDLIIEILSPSTAYYDMRKKFRVYERSGVKEYWIVDPEMNSVEIYLNKNGHFLLHSRGEEKGEAESSLIEGLKIMLDDIFSQI